MLNYMSFSELTKVLNIPLIYPIMFLVAVAIFLLIVGAFKNLHKSFYIGISSFSLLISFLMVLKLDFGKAFLDTFLFDELSFLSICMILTFSILYLLMENEENKSEFYALFLFMIASLMLMVSSTNLMMIFIALESSSLVLYTLIALKADRNSVSSALKYFSVAGVGSGFFVLASALLYLKTGQIDLYEISKLDINLNDYFVLSCFTMIFILCAIKLSLVPFHFWLKDVYFATNSNLTAFISVVPKIAMIAFVARIFMILQYSYFDYVITFLVIFSMFSASIVSLIQTNIKKMLAYSSITHSSFVLVSLMVLLNANSDFMIGNYNNIDYLIFFGVFVYWFIFAFSNYGLFLMLSTFKNTNYQSLNGMLTKKPFLAIILSIFTLSLIGIPPFGIFLGKVYVMTTAIISDYWYLALCIGISSAIMLYAYLKIIINALFIKSDNFIEGKLNFRQNVILGICFIMSTFCAIFVLSYNML